MRAKSASTNSRVAVNMARHIIEELPDDPHMLGADLVARLRGRHVRQLRRQRFTGQRGPRPQQFGLLDAALGFLLADAQRFREHLGPGIGAELGPGSAR
jgi:hypothetical protein